MLLPEKQKGASEEYSPGTNNSKSLPFVEVAHFLDLNHVRVPEIFGVCEPYGVLWLEDFGDELLLKNVQNKPDATLEKRYTQALDLLIQIATIPIEPRPTLLNKQFNEDLYNWEFMHFVECALDKGLKKPVRPNDRAEIIKELFKLTDEFLSWDLKCVHRDFHGRNLICIDEPNHPLGLIDFQDVLLGPVFYDLASLLRDSYFRIPKNLQLQLVEHYRLMLKEKKSHLGLTQAGFEHAFDLMGLQRNLKAAGRFFFFLQHKGNGSYLKDVPLSLTYILESFERHEDLAPLKKVITPYFHELIEITKSC